MIHTLIILTLAGCTPRGPELICQFRYTAKASAQHVRLETSCPLPVYLNGLTISAGPGPTPVTDYLSGQGENTLRMSSDCAPARLLLTPRVYIARIAAEGNGLAVTIENTLENTVSVSLQCRGTTGAHTASATIPAHSQTQLAIDVLPKSKVRCEVEKLPDALEESYRFQLETNYQ